MITPSLEQINAVKSWTDLFISLGLNPRNDRACKKVKDYVREHYPNSHLERYRTNAGRFQDSEFAALVARCQSVAEIIREGGWKIAGGTHAMIWNRIRYSNLSTEHFLGAAHNRGKTNIKKHPIEYYLVKDGPLIGSAKLKARMFKEGLKQKTCERCQITEWQGEPAPLELDHINGNNRDNRLENLRILCANCHSLTPTHSAKNIKSSPMPKCSICESEVRVRRNKTCGAYACVSQHQSERLMR